LKEYGSNVQKFVDYLGTIDDRDKRTKYAHILVELMRQVHPGMKDSTQDFYQRLWDDLYIMSDFKLEVDSPFPPPSKESVGRKPKYVAYSNHNLRFRHYGRNLELMVNKACDTENPEDRKAFVNYLIKMMKSFYTSWNKDSTEDKVLLEQLLLMSGGRLRVEIEAYSRGEIVEASPKDRYNANYTPNQNRTNLNFSGKNETRLERSENSRNDYQRNDSQRNDRRNPNNQGANAQGNGRNPNNNQQSRQRNPNNIGNTGNGPSPLNQNNRNRNNKRK
jgi:hypothetical protein